MRILFMGRKPVAAECLRYLLHRGVDVVAVVTDDACVEAVTHRPVMGNSEAYACAEGFGDIDLVVSVLHHERVRQPLLGLGRLGAINFHPAPLPMYRGMWGYNYAILEGQTEWAVSAHYMDERIDTGDVIAERRFPMDADKDTAWDLERRSQVHLYGLFKQVMDMFIDGATIPRTRQGEGRYLSKAMGEAEKRIKPGDDVERKARAFFFPPWPGAQMTIDGRDYTLLPSELMRRVSTHD